MGKNKAEDIITENSKNESLFLEFKKLVKINEYLYTKLDDPKEKMILILLTQQPDRMVDYLKLMRQMGNSMLLN